ncbi:MAG: DPP IV N-terminal domain-containing protein [Bacteroidota bacterium]
MKRILLLVVFITAHAFAPAQVRWAADGQSYYQTEGGDIVQYTLPAQTRQVLVTKAELTPPGGTPLTVRLFQLSNDGRQVLIFTNTQKVWRLDTRGDYYVFNLASRQLRQLGAGLPPRSLMFAKLSPDGTRAAYVSRNELYVEDLATQQVTALTNDRKPKLINGTFDWAYEEEFACRDGFQWSPDSKHIAFWQIDASKIRDFYMINNTDSVYSQIVPVEYPTAGETPSPARIGVVNLSLNKTTWLAIPGEAHQNYLPRMEWTAANELLVQQLNRKQNESRIYQCNPHTGEARAIYSERDEAWIDVYTPWENVYAIDFRHRFRWINNGKEFLWFSEKDGWRHLYRIGLDGKEKLITNGAYDVMDIRAVDEKSNTLWFLASPANATQKYLFKTKLDGSGKAEQVSPATQPGTHDYNVSPNGKFAFHTFSNAYTQRVTEWIALPAHQAINGQEPFATKMKKAEVEKTVEFFKVNTADGVEMDAWMVRPNNFDPAKKYPVVFMVYTEPWGANVHDTYGVADNFLFNGDMAEEGYFYITIDNRGTPAPKGRAWRKSIYRKVGLLNISDQAAAAKEILKWPYIDPERVAVWGWSGGGSATLNLLFQYPKIYKTGIAVAAVANQLTYDNMYQERYMGLPQENLEDFVKGSPITYAKNLRGNLLYIHGTGDDNVHYANAEMLIDELVKHGKQFQLMVYPNRTHSISEGEGTFEHLSTLYSNFLRQHCPPGGR